MKYMIRPQVPQIVFHMTLPIAGYPLDAFDFKTNGIDSSFEFIKLTEPFLALFVKRYETSRFFLFEISSTAYSQYCDKYSGLILLRRSDVLIEMEFQRTFGFYDPVRSCNAY